MGMDSIITEYCAEQDDDGDGNKNRIAAILGYNDIARHKQLRQHVVN